MKILFALSGLLSNMYMFAGSVVGSLMDIEESEVPETAAAHCNIHWSILCIIAIYGIYAALRAAYIKKALWSDDTTDTTHKKHANMFHLDTIIGTITLLILCLSKRFWTCSVDYKVAAAGSLIVIIITIMMELLNQKLYNREKC